MQKFLSKTLLFFTIVVIIDVLSGILFAYLVKHANGGENWRNNCICDSVNDDILIFGSSRATVDLLVGEDNHKYLKWLKPYYDRTGIPEVFESVDDTEKYKMLSQMYRYNSNCIQIICDYLHHLQSNIKGFCPLNEEMDTMMVRKVAIKQETPVYDSLKISYIRKMVEESIDTKIIFVVSPIWNGADTIPYQPIRDICREKNIPFLDFLNNPKYVHNNAYFKDGAHLNARGADEFTKDLIRHNCLHLSIALANYNFYAKKESKSA